MDNNGFNGNKCSSNAVELEMKQHTENSVTADEQNRSQPTPNIIATGQKHYCEPELCQRLHGKFVQKESNWNRWKTNFLLTIIASFVLWLIAFFVFPLLF